MKSIVLLQAVTELLCFVKTCIFVIVKMFAVAMLTFVVSLAFTSAQNPNCDFYQKVEVGLVYEVRSLNYPSSYPRGMTCRWSAKCPVGYNCRLDCNSVNLPQTPSCSGDRILVSENGDPKLYGAVARCGNKPFTVISVGQDLTIGSISSISSPGGAFRCLLSAQIAPAPQPTCRCGETKQNRIVGGQETGVNEYRMLAALISVTNARIKCGAVIINERYALTAAHCVTGETLNSTFLLVGDHDISTGADTSSAKGYRLERIIPHPQYNPSIYDYDIALLKTVQTMEFNDQVGPVCLPFKYVNYDFTNSYVTLVGWGTLSPGGPTSNTPRKVDVQVISQSQCKLYVPTLTNRQICTYTPGKDACQYDSGGPGFYRELSSGRLYLLFHISHGRFCASEDPSVNTLVTVILSWIESVTQSYFCKI